MKIVAMIPARIGSKRVKNKNLRLINGRPLIEYVLETVNNVDIFDDIYINSEDDIFNELAEKYRFKFYKRPFELSSDAATNDEFAYNFLKNIEVDLLIQILPTSPFISTEEINMFTNKILHDKLDTLISVEHNQIACVYKGKAVNYEILAKNPPSQKMEPVMSYATSLMGWTSKSFVDNFEKHGVAYHGGNGKTGYFELRGLSTIDIDREEDFVLAEAIILSQSDRGLTKKLYYTSKDSGKNGI